MAGTSKTWRHAAVVLFVAQIGGGFALAQSSEYGRVSGGEIEVVTKEARKLSGSLALSSARPAGGLGSLKGFEGTLGGTIVEDRLWFFAAAARNEILRFSPELTELAQPVLTNALDGKVMAQLGSRQDFSASYSAGRETVPATAMTLGAVPSSFLSLRYTALVSSNMSFDMSVSRRSIAP